MADKKNRELVANVKIVQPMLSPEHAAQVAKNGEALIRELGERAKLLPQAVVPMSLNINAETPILEVKRRYITHKIGQGLSPATIRGVESMFSMLYKFFADTLIKKETIEKATKEEIDNALAFIPLMVIEQDGFEDIYKMWMENKGYKETSVWEERIKFITFYRYCSDNLKVVKPKKFNTKKANAPIKPLFTDEQIIKLLEKPKDLANNFVEHRDWLITLYTHNTGNRRRSIINIQMKDLDMLNDGYVKLQKTKNGKPQIVYIPEKVVRAMREYINMWRYDASGDDYLFTDKYGNQLSPDNLSHIIIRYMKRRLGDDCPASASIHLLRHQYAAFFVKNGGSMFDLKKQLGHSTFEMVNLYANHYGNPNGEIIEKTSPINYYYKAINKEPLKPKKKK